MVTIFEVILYEDEKGNNPVLEFLTELANNNGKDSRVRLRKVQDYINILQAYGNTVGAPVMKHLDDEIWELRPLRDRVLLPELWVEDMCFCISSSRKHRKLPKERLNGQSVN